MCESPGRSLLPTGLIFARSFHLGPGCTSTRFPLEEKLLQDDHSVSRDIFPIMPMGEETRWISGTWQILR